MSYQAAQGVDAKLAHEVMDDQEALADAITALGVDLGGEAGVWVEPTSSGQTIHARTEDPSIGRALTAEAAFLVSEVVISDEPVVAERVPYDAVEVAATVTAVSPAAQGLYVRASDGVLVVETLDNLSESEVEMLTSQVGFDAVEVVVLDEPARDTITIYGGAALKSCTSGFAATRGAQRGFYSAAHCGASQRIYQSASSTSGSSALGTPTAQVHNANADIGFYSVPTGGNTLSGRFYGSGGTLTATGAAASAIPGATACHRGKASGWACGSITTIAYQPTWSNACNGTTCNAVFVRVSAKTAGGDSGGPWVLSNNRAIGIHKGGASSWSVYSKLSRVPSGTSLYYG